MNKYILTLVFSILIFSLNAQYQTNTNFQNSNEFLNPVFSGDYPDPSILVDGDDFYVIHSSFEYYPGLTIWHSNDLINWTPVNSTLTTYVGSVWAPDLVKYGDKYYIYFPALNTNYVVYADSITGKWSEPIDLKVGNIDPGHITDDEGNRYLYFSNGGYVSLSKDGLSVSGEFQQTYEGWPIPREWTIECFCMEGPKLFKRGDYYYLTVAEGGTAGPATGHMVISARSKSPLGPWENSPYNPILRAESKADKWWSVGHASIFEASEDNWWMIFHGYENGHHNMGRQTMLAPLEWTKDGWFKTPNDFDVAKPIKKPFGKGNDIEEVENNAFNINNWKFFGEYDKDRYEISDNSITINAKGNSIAESSPLLRIPANHSYSAEVEIDIKGDATAGLVLFYNQMAFSGILANAHDILANLRGWQFTTEANVINRKVYLKIENIENTVDMYYSLDGKDWLKIESSLESSAYHHNVLGGFLSLKIGLVSLGDGKVEFSNFKYKAL